MKSKIKNLILLGGVTLVFSSCADVRAYQMALLQDDSMQTNASSLEKLENETESYREGSSGGLGGKTGGGCGCN
ncbi:hypothetical protein D3C87_429550 [compost metagenome]